MNFSASLTSSASAWLVACAAPTRGAQPPHRDLLWALCAAGDPPRLREDSSGRLHGLQGTRRPVLQSRGMVCACMVWLGSAAPGGASFNQLRLKQSSCRWFEES